MHLKSRRKNFYFYSITLHLAMPVYSAADEPLSMMNFDTESESDDWIIASCRKLGSIPSWQQP